MTSEHIIKILTMSLFVLLKILCKDNSKRYLCMILSRSLVQIYLIQPRYIHTNYLFKILIRSCLPVPRFQDLAYKMFDQGCPRNLPQSFAYAGQASKLQKPRERRFQKNSRDFGRLHWTSRDFRRLQKTFKTSWDFMTEVSAVFPLTF